MAGDGSRKLFGEERILHDLGKNKNASAIETVDYLKQHVTVFADGLEQGDDLTLMFLRNGSSQKHASHAPRRIIMKNEMSEVGRMRGFIFSVCREHNVDEETVKTLNLAAEECVANVINYAYPKGIRGHVELTAEIVGGQLTLTVKDHGVAFDPTRHQDIDVEAGLDDRPIGGLGIHLVKTIMDTMTYQRTVDGYNVLTLTKQIN
jgi:sigma-B regulation protein RsbU (phosphoserine phosphatase)